MSTKNSSRFTPVIIAISVVIGILIGTFYAKHFAGNRLGIINGSSNKLNALLRIVDDQYVDTVNMTDLVEKAMPQILAELDPHSTYIPAQNLEEVNAELEGSFSGIGIQFTIQNDTIHVNAVIQGGPSEKVGLMAGDRIVTVDDSLFVGKKVTNERAILVMAFASACNTYGFVRLFSSSHTFSKPEGVPLYPSEIIILSLTIKAPTLRRWQ